MRQSSNWRTLSQPFWEAYPEISLEKHHLSKSDQCWKLIIFLNSFFIIGIWQFPKVKARTFVKVFYICCYLQKLVWINIFAITPSSYANIHVDFIIFLHFHRLLKYFPGVNISIAFPSFFGSLRVMSHKILSQCTGVAVYWKAVWDCSSCQLAYSKPAGRWDMWTDASYKWASVKRQHSRPFRMAWNQKAMLLQWWEVQPNQWCDTQLAEKDRIYQRLTY